nr:Homeobox domain containing protein [Haemonchus contortus]
MLAFGSIRYKHELMESETSEVIAGSLMMVQRRMADARNTMMITLTIHTPMKMRNIYWPRDVTFPCNRYRTGLGTGEFDRKSRSDRRISQNFSSYILSFCVTLSL